MKKGFTIIEIIVAVSIIAILSASATVVWGGTSDAIANKQTAGVIKDIIQNAEIKSIQNGISEIILNFTSDFIIQEEIYTNSNLVMNINDACDGIVIKTSGTLYKMTDNGNNFESEYINSLSRPIEICFNFKNSSNIRWIYRLENGDEKRAIEYAHFNLKRDGAYAKSVIANSYSIGADSYNLNSDELYLKIIAPYGKKELYPEKGELTLTIQNEDDDSVTEELVLQF